MCGIVGIIGGKPASRLIYHSLFSIQHRGQTSAGMLLYDGNIQRNPDLSGKSLMKREKLTFPVMLALAILDIQQRGWMILNH